MASHTRDTSAPSDSAFATDKTRNIAQPPAPAKLNHGSTGSQGAWGPSTGTDNNVDRSYGEGEEKRGFMDKVKDKLTPGIKGPDTNADHSTKHAATFETDQLKGRHGQANANLNRE